MCISTVIITFQHVPSCTDEAWNAETCACLQIVLYIYVYIYQATVTTNDNKPDQTYVGLTANTFKTRFTNHKASFTSAKKKHSTELSKYIWRLNEKNIDHEIKWKILRRASAYSNTSNRCNLCLWEKYFIICKPTLATLNKRNELLSSCRHANKFLFRNFVT